MVFLDHYSNYPYSHLVRVTSDNETFQSKEVYKHLAVTHSISIYFYNEYHERSLDTLFKVSSKYFGKRIIYCGLVSHNQNTIVECRIKEFILGRRCTPLYIPPYYGWRLWALWPVPYHSRYCARGTIALIWGNMELQKSKTIRHRIEYLPKILAHLVLTHIWAKIHFAGSNISINQVLNKI